MAEWIRHQTSDLGIAGSSPVTVEAFLLSTSLMYQRSFVKLSTTLNCSQNALNHQFYPPKAQKIFSHRFFSEKSVESDAL